MTRIARKLTAQVLYRITVLFSLALKRVSRQSWESVLDRVENTPTQGIQKSMSGAPEEASTKPLESQASQGLSAYTTHQNVPVYDMPRWAREIQTFLANQLSRHTRNAYESDLKMFFRFLESRVDLSDIGSLRADHIILYRKQLEEGRLNGRVYQKSTINRKLAVVKSFLNWLRVNSVVSENPAQLVKGFPQSQESSLKGLSDEETRKILDLPNRNSRSGALHGALLHVLFYLGLRKGELTGLKMGDLDSERGVDVIRVRGKGHRVRILPITEGVRYALEHYFKVCSRNKEEKEAPLFIPTKNNRTHIFHKRLNPNAVTYIVQKYAKKAGILKPISPHSCRATCISNALDNRATHRSVQHLAGWSTPLMIQRYDKRREDLKNSAAFQIDYGKEDEPATA